MRNSTGGKAHMTNISMSGASVTSSYAVDLKYMEGAAFQFDVLPSSAGIVSGTLHVQASCDEYKDAIPNQRLTNWTTVASLPIAFSGSVNPDGEPHAFMLNGPLAYYNATRVKYVNLSGSPVFSIRVSTKGV